MKKFIYFCGLIVLVSLYASCGDSSEYFDEHFVYKTKATRGMDMRNEPIDRIIVLETERDVPSDETDIGKYGTATTSFSWVAGSIASSCMAIEAPASCQISLYEDSVYRVVANNRIRNTFNIGSDGYAYASYNVAIKDTNDIRVFYGNVTFRSSKTVKTGTPEENSNQFP